MFLLGQKRYLDFTVNSGTSDGEGSVGIAGLVLTDFVTGFFRNGIPNSDVVSLLAYGNGRYAITYTPSTEGHDYFEVVYVPTSFDQSWSEDIISAQTLLGGSSAISLTQNTPTSNALQVTAANPSSYTLYVYRSSDWQTGNTATYTAVGSTQLDTSGNWLSTPISVISGTYHIVIRDGSGAVQVIKAYLQV